MNEDKPRSRGRPEIGAVVPVRMSAADRAIAERLACGKVAEGVRLALKVASTLSQAQIQKLLKKAEQRAPTPARTPVIGTSKKTKRVPKK